MVSPRRDIFAKTIPGPVHQARAYDYSAVRCGVPSVARHSLRRFGQDMMSSMAT